MAVAPSILVHEPKNILQKAQRAEYNLSIYNKKMLAFLNGIHVTPGPFSIFRKKVFDDLGPYRKAHNTEDQEIALRMQEFGYRIEHCPDAYVYTVSPPTVMKLYRQRLRWIYGFIKNAVDYRRLMFKKKHGTVGMFTMPSGFISVFSVLFLFGFLVYNLVSFIIKKIEQIRTVGISFSFSSFSFDWFFLSTKSIVFISFFLYFFIIMALVLGRKVSGGKARVSFDIVYFILIFSVIAPFWIVKAFINAIVSKESSWTQERKVTNN
jgi:cellulose synthase/poly-beta-1,6-N-acetylglucosamine synthase-like glycosyltransferase